MLLSWSLNNILANSLSFSHFSSHQTKLFFFSWSFGRLWWRVSSCRTSQELLNNSWYYRSFVGPDNGLQSCDFQRQNSEYIYILTLDASIQFSSRIEFDAMFGSFRMSLLKQITAFLMFKLIVIYFFRFHKGLRLLEAGSEIRFPSYCQSLKFGFPCKSFLVGDRLNLDFV